MPQTRDERNSNHIRKPHPEKRNWSTSMDPHLGWSSLANAGLTNRHSSSWLNASVLKFCLVNEMVASLWLQVAEGNVLSVVCAYTVHQTAALITWHFGSLWTMSWKRCHLGISLFFWVTSMHMWALMDLSGRGWLGGMFSFIWIWMVFDYWTSMLIKFCALSITKTEFEHKWSISVLGTRPLGQRLVIVFIMWHQTCGPVLCLGHLGEDRQSH